MKNVMPVFALIAAAVVFQSCESKVKEAAATEEANESEQTKLTEQIAAKRAELAKLTAERNEKRKMAAKELAASNATYKNANGKVIYRLVDVYPYYTGGEEAMVNYLNENLQYPQEAKDKGVEGTVYVDFVVDENGNVKDVVATDFIGDEFDQILKDEAVRVVSAMPAWVAGHQNGKNVDTAFSIPITFRLNN